MTTEQQKTKAKKQRVRYNLSLPAAVYSELCALAEREGVSRQEVIRRFVKLGIMVSEYGHNHDRGFYFKRDGEFERIVMF